MTVKFLTCINKTNLFLANHELELLAHAQNNESVQRPKIQNIGLTFDSAMPLSIYIAIIRMLLNAKAEL